MDIVYHVSEVTFLLLAGGLIFWFHTPSAHAGSETARAPVYIKENERLRR